VIGLSGRFRSSIVIGLQGIRARKVRTLLSMVSLFLGVLAVVVVQAGASLAEEAQLADLELTAGKDGTMQLFLPPDPDVVPIVLDTVRGRSDVVVQLGVQATIGEPNVTAINAGGSSFDNLGGGGQNFAPPGGFLVCDPNSGMCFKRIGGGGDAADRPPPPGQAIDLQLVALTGDIRQFVPYRPEAGQWLEFDSPPSLSPRIVVNREAAKGFGRYQVPAEMRIEGNTANSTPRIVGVVHDGNSQPTAYVRADELLNWLPAASLGNGGVRVMFAPSALDLVQILRSKLVAVGMPAETLNPQTINSRKDIADRLELTRLIFLGMAGLVLLIGVAGILNVGLATVGERVEEFALRRAVGTPRSLLASIVLAETLLTGLLTSAAAIGVAALAFRFMVRLLDVRAPFLTHADFPWQAGVAGVVAGLVAGLLGGLVPALRAARIPIASVMRA
jgi:putative ABC transport system permease protein